ncbi:MAG TPA: GtrA family protein [Gemmataceae bacterium]|jgi:putative flippase GtrA|nr:GtrA family protein [Gemmataceae bacterium]
MIRKLSSLFAGRTDNGLVQLFRYTLVGGLAFVVDFVSLFLLKEVGGLHYLGAAALAFTLGLITNYCISISWVFGQRAVKNWQAEFVIFALLGVMGLGLNELSMFLLTGVLGLHYLVSKLVSTAVTYLWNFLSRKALLFSASAEEQGAVPAPVTVEVRPAD